MQKWIIKYKISDIVDYITGVEDEEQFLNSLLRGAVIKTSGHYTIVDAWNTGVEKFDREVGDELRGRIGAVKCGISIDSVERRIVGPPLQTAGAFISWQNASEESNRMKEQAELVMNNKLNAAAGIAQEMLSRDIKALEQAENAGDAAAIQRLRAQLDQRLMNAGGEASGIIEEAKSYRNRIVREAQGDADRLEKILPQFKQNPEIYIDQVYLEMIQEVLKSVKETRIIVSDDPENEELRLIIPRDPDLEREEQRLKQIENRKAMETGKQK